MVVFLSLICFCWVFVWCFFRIQNHTEWFGRSQDFPSPEIFQLPDSQESTVPSLHERWGQAFFPPGQVGFSRYFFVSQRSSCTRRPDVLKSRFGLYVADLLDRSEWVWKPYRKTIDVGASGHIWIERGGLQVLASTITSNVGLHFEALWYFLATGLCLYVSKQKLLTAYSLRDWSMSKRCASEETKKSHAANILTQYLYL